MERWYRRSNTFDLRSCPLSADCKPLLQIHSVKTRSANCPD